MEVSNNVCPNAVVRMIPVLSCFNILTDYLITENALEAKDQHKPIQVINSLYYFLYNDMKNIECEVIEQKKLLLAQTLQYRLQFYGIEINEEIDPIFANVLLKHLITSIVFNKYSSINGFLAEFARNSEDYRVHSILERILNFLKKEKFLNEDGSYSILSSKVAFLIVQEFINPLFPVTNEDLRLTTPDYIYAQAGAVFLTNQKCGSTNLKGCMKNKEAEPVRKHNFDEQVTLAVETIDAIVAKEMSYSALKMFQPSALFYYLLKEQNQLANISTVQIVNNGTHLLEAYKLLFQYINEEFSINDMTAAIEDDFVLRWKLVFSTFKNRTKLAMQIIKHECPFIPQSNLTKEITRYKNHAKTYQCDPTSKQVLPNINEIYAQQVDTITKSFVDFEKESIKQAFEDIFANEAIIISKGKLINSAIRRFFRSFIPQDLPDRHELFQIHFLANDTFLYYALFRHEYIITLIPESDDPDDFRRKLHLSSKKEFKPSAFKKIMKTEDETLEDFANKTAYLREREFRKFLYASGYEQTTREWWIEFGLSFIPFFSCMKGIKERDVPEIIISCALDSLMLIPAAGEVASVSGKLAVSSSRNLLKQEAKTIARNAFKNAGSIKNSGSLLKNFFKKVGKSILRFFDPGFEVLYDFGKFSLKKAKGALKKTNRFSNTVQKIEVLEKKLLTMEEKLSSPASELDTLISYVVNHLLFSFGSKGLEADNRLVEQLPVVFDPENETSGFYLDPLTGVVAEPSPRDDLESKDFESIEVAYAIPGNDPDVDDYTDMELCSVIDGKREKEQSSFSCLRLQLQDREDNETNFLVENSYLSNETARYQLRKHVLPTNMRKKFIHAWLLNLQNENDRPPDWSIDYEIEDAEMFYLLKYELTLEKDDLEVGEAMERIKKLQEIHSNFLRSDTSMMEIQKLLQDFLERNLNEMCNFEDAYFLLQYFRNAFQSYGGYVLKTNAMRGALYRLAIRQAFNFRKRIEVRLFALEVRDIGVTDKLFQGNEYLEFSKFTAAFESEEIVNRAISDLKTNEEFLHVVYDTKFSNDYIRIVIGHATYGQINILLPGSKFMIDNIVEFEIDTKKCLRVELSFIPNFMTEDEWYRMIMNELEKLKYLD